MINLTEVIRLKNPTPRDIQFITSYLKVDQYNDYYYYASNDDNDSPSHIFFMNELICRIHNQVCLDEYTEKFSNPHCIAVDCDLPEFLNHLNNNRS